MEAVMRAIEALGKMESAANRLTFLSSYSFLPSC
jgi:hypothetical protein